jgi:hypothetical protein
MEYWVHWMDALPGSNFSESIAVFAQRIRQTEPDYNTPRDRGDYSRTIIFLVFAGLIVIALVIIVSATID